MAGTVMWRYVPRLWYAALLSVAAAAAPYKCLALPLFLRPAFCASPASRHAPRTVHARESSRSVLLSLYVSYAQP